MSTVARGMSEGVELEVDDAIKALEVYAALDTEVLKQTVEGPDMVKLPVNDGVKRVAPITLIAPNDPPALDPPTIYEVHFAAGEEVGIAEGLASPNTRRLDNWISPSLSSSLVSSAVIAATSRS